MNVKFRLLCFDRKFHRTRALKILFTYCTVSCCLSLRFKRALLTFSVKTKQKKFVVVHFVEIRSSDQLMPCPFTGPKMFCATPNFLSQPKNLTAFSVSSKTFVPAQKTILLNANHLFVWHKMFVTDAICK